MNALEATNTFADQQPGEDSLIRQIQLAGQRVNADCHRCSFNKLFDSKLCHQPDLLSFDRGETIARHGCEDRYLYSIRQGSVKISSHELNGDEQVLNFHFPNDIFGLENLICASRQRDVIALENCLICRLPIQHIQACQEPEHSYSALLRLLGRNELNHQAQVSLIKRRQAYRRLAGFLLDIASRLRGDRRESLTFQLPMSRMDIASYLGLTVETVSRRLSALQQQRIVSIDGSRRTVQILDLTTLQHIAHD